MTPTFACGFECGKLGPHWGANSGTPAFSTSTVNNGVYSLRCNASGSPVNASNFGWGDGSALTVYRFYIRFASLPTGNTFLWWKEQTSPATKLGLFFQSTDSKLYCRVGTTNGATGFTVTTDQWYCVDIKLNQTGGAATTVDAQIDGSALGQASASGGTTTSSFPLCGIEASVTGDVYFDDVVTSTTSGDYPIGTGKVLGFVPASDGTHTSTSTNITKGTAATPVGAAIVSGTTDSFNWINARPIGGGATDNTRLINQQTASSTQYVEHGIEQTSESSAPRAVEVLLIHQQAGAQAGTSTFKVNDNGTEDTILARSGNGITSDQYDRKHYATMVGGGAWTLARFKALKLRFGYSSDATPDQYLRGWMVEAEFAVAAAPPAASLVLGVNRPRFYAQKRRI